MTVRDLSPGAVVKGRHRTGRSVAEFLPVAPPSSGPVVPPTGSAVRESATVVLDAGVPAPRRPTEPYGIPSPRRAVEPFDIPAPRPAEQELLPVGCAAPAGPERPVPYRWRPDLPSPRRFIPPFTKPFGVRLAAALIGLAVLGAVPSAAGRVIEDRGAPDHTRVTPRPALPPPGTTRTLTGSLDAERAPLAAPVPVEFTHALPDARAAVALRAAMAQLGLPYQWGGDGPTAGDAGFDCSGLTTFAYAAAGIRLPRTAHTQFGAGPHVPAGSPLQPGDLVFYGTPDAVHHVGMYLGEGRMVNAPTFGQPVRTAYYRWRGDDYLGATRPAADGPRTAGELPFEPTPVPAPATEPRQRIFQAPAAPLPAGPLPTPRADLPPEPQTAAAAIAAAGPALSGDPDPTAVHPSGMTLDDVPAAEPVAAGAGVGSPATGSIVAGPGTPAGPGDAPDPSTAARALAPAAAFPAPADTVPAARTATEPAPSTSAGATAAAADPTAAAPTTTVPSTTVPTTAVPTTTAPRTTDPTTTAPTTVEPTTPVTTAPPAPRHVTLTGPSEFPLFPGQGASRTVFDLDSAAPVQDLRPGDVVDAALPDGSTRSFTVRTREVLSADTAAAVLKTSTKPLVVRAPLPDGTYLVLTGTPAAP
jgi:hypothetical protein